MPSEKLHAAGRQTSERPIRLAFRGVQRKARAVLDGERCYTDDVLRFVKSALRNGQRYTALSGILGLSYDELVDLGLILRKRAKVLRSQRNSQTLGSFCWN